MHDYSLDHVRGIISCSHFSMQPGRQPGGPQLAAGLEKVELVTRGRCWAFDGSSEVEATTGTLIWHHPGERLISRTDERDPYACLVVTWAVDRPEPRRVPRFTRWDDRSEILAYTRQILASYSDERIDRRALALASYAHLQWRAHLWTATATDPDVPAQLRRVLAALEAEPGRRWSVAAMAAHAGWSPSRLHAAFRAHVRQSPHQHLLELRLRRAREQLSATHDSLDAIALRTGLGCAAMLCRQFRRHVGMSPGEYRQRQE